jgi:hypothetical protein
VRWAGCYLHVLVGGEYVQVNISMYCLCASVWCDLWQLGGEDNNMNTLCNEFTWAQKIQSIRALVWEYEPSDDLEMTKPGRAVAIKKYVRTIPDSWPDTLKCTILSVTGYTAWTNAKGMVRVSIYLILLFVVLCSFLVFLYLQGCEHIECVWY